MPLCPAGQKTTIEWQYTGEQLNRIIEADDYSLSPVYSQRTRYRWEYSISQTITSYSGLTLNAVQGCNGIPGLYRQCSIQPPRTSEVDSGSNRRASIIYAPIYKYRVIDLGTADRACVPFAEIRACGFPSGWRKIQLLCHGASTPSVTPVWVTIWDSTGQYEPAAGAMLQNTSGGEFNINYDPILDRYRFIPSDQPDWGEFRFVAFDNRLPNQCQFKVSKNGLVVYQRTASTCPAVTYFCGEKCPPRTCECTCGTEVCCYDTTTGKAIKSFKK
jgi:hypothetical protein